MGNIKVEPIEILLVDDNPGDVRLVIESLKDGKIANHMNVVWDGVEAMDFLRKLGKFSEAPNPDIVLLDLNMPKKGGHEVMAEMKEDPLLKDIPVVVLTTSDADLDIIKSYDKDVSCYVTKPLDTDKFIEAVRSISSFWLTVVKMTEGS
ncbi:MAG TPA: response regulator [Methanocella sp.]|nr:response regulator [Methanocella sp.]